MKYCFILFLFLFTACTKAEDFKTTKAEKWNLLEDIFLFEDKESIKTYEKIEKSIQWQALLQNEKAKKEEQEWRNTKIDFFLDLSRIIDASKTVSNYEVSKTENLGSDIRDTLSNGMEIEHSENKINIFFPKEESGFRRMTSFILENDHSILFQGKEIGGSINPLEMEILFSDTDYEITYYNTPLSEKTWEKIFFISILYYNDFIRRHSLRFQDISLPKERKNNELQ